MTRTGLREKRPPVADDATDPFTLIERPARARLVTFFSSFLTHDRSHHLPTDMKPFSGSILSKCYFYLENFIFIDGKFRLKEPVNRLLLTSPIGHVNHSR